MTNRYQITIDLNGSDFRRVKMSYYIHMTCCLNPESDKKINAPGIDFRSTNGYLHLKRF